MPPESDRRRPTENGRHDDALTTALATLPADDAATPVPITKALRESPIGITIGDAAWDHVPLVYVNDSFTELTGYPASWALGRSCSFLQGPATDPAKVDQLRAAIEHGEQTTVELRNYRRDGEMFWNRVTLAPLHDESGETTHFVGFQEDVTERRQAELAGERRAAELEAERERLDRLQDRVEGLLAETTSAVATATTPGDVRESAVECLADTYEAAWVGEVDRVEREVVPDALAGLDDAPAPLSDDGPVSSALSTGEVVTSTTLARDGGDEATVVPLRSQGTTYGVVVVETAADIVDDRERVVLGAIGRVVATALDARESQRLLTADQVVNMEFALPPAELDVVTLATELNADLEYVGTVADGDGAPSLFFQCPVAPKTVTDATPDLPSDAAVVRGDEDGSIVEFVPSDGDVVHTLSVNNARIYDFTVGPASVRLGVEIPPTTEARAVATALREQFSEAELLAKTTQERPARTHGEFVGQLGERLTDRQQEALRRAYFGGYFEWPHATSGEELADSMGVSRSTFHQHLRAAQRKIVGEFCDPETE
ncbi:MAG: bacterio-opsin activator domain-containing protein [Halolamina sp.]